MIQLEALHSFPIDEYLLTRIAFSPDGSELAVGHKQFSTYSAETGQPRTTFPFPDFLAQLRYSPDGRFIAAANVADNHPSTRGKLQVFDAQSGDLHYGAEAPQPVQTLAFGTDGDLYWNHANGEGGSIAGARLSPIGPLPSVATPALHVRGLARISDGFVGFGREAVGSSRQVEGADLVFRKFRLVSLDDTGGVRHDFDLGIGAGVHSLSPDGKLLAVEMVDFKNNERHVSLIDVETGVEANLLPLEANTLPVLEFGLGSEYLMCMKEDAESSFNILRVWRTEDLKLVGEARVPLHYHTLASRLEHSLVGFLGGGKLDLYALS